jgi:hypothetical protein
MVVKKKYRCCCTKVIMSGVNGKVIMSGCGDDNPDDERREAARGMQRVFRGELTVLQQRKIRV